MRVMLIDPERIRRLFTKGEREELGFDPDEDPIEEFRDYFEEAGAYGVWEFFGITVRDERYVVLPEGFDLEKAKGIVNEYLDLVDDDRYFDNEYGDEPMTDAAGSYSQETIDYEWWTRLGGRGGDDGTYDYCGSFVDVCLEIFERFINEKG